MGLPLTPEFFNMMCINLNEHFSIVADDTTTADKIFVSDVH